METIENVKIKIPEGYEIDKETSVINLEKGIVNIKFKKKVERWSDNDKAKITGYYITQELSKINKVFRLPNIKASYNVFATEKQAKSALAMARISQIMANDARFGGIITDEEWNNVDITKVIIYRFRNRVQTSAYCDSYHFLAFHTIEQTNLFLEENEDLVKQYFMID